MQKHRIFGKAAMLFSAALLISTGGAIFAAANENMLSNEIDRIIEVAAVDMLPPAVTMANPNAEPAALPDFTSADYTVIDYYAVNGKPPEGPDLPESAMTAQEAADVCAAFFGDTFGYSSKGKTYSMSYYYSGGIEGEEAGNRVAWLCQVEGEAAPRLAIDAITGEFIDTGRELPNIEAKIDGEGMPDNYASLWNSHKDNYLLTAKNFVEKILSTKTTSAALANTTAMSYSSDDGIEDREIEFFYLTI